MKSFGNFFNDIQASNFVGFIFTLTERKQIDYKNQSQLKAKL